MPPVPVARRVLPWLGYFAFFGLCFVLFAYWSFPYDRLRAYAVQQFKASQTGGRGAAPRYDLQIGELGPSGFLGLAAADVSYTKLSVKPDGTPGTLTVDQLSVRPALLSLLLGTKAADFRAEAGGGEVEGSVSQNDDTVEIDLELESLDLGQLGLGDYLGLPLTGKATGTIDLHLPKDATQSEGTVQLVLEGVTLGDGKAKLSIPGMRDGFTIERVDAGKLEVDIRIEEGNATINKFGADGEDIVIDISGSARLATPAGRTRLKLTLEAKFSEAYKSRDAKTKALFELMGFRPELKRATTKDGALRFLVNGTLGVPQARPAGRTPSRPAGSK